jgi:hypothetical protein
LRPKDPGEPREASRLLRRYNRASDSLPYQIVVNFAPLQAETLQFETLGKGTTSVVPPKLLQNQPRFSAR